MLLSLSSHPIPGRPTSDGRPLPTDVTRLNRVQFLAARAFDPRLSASDHLAVILRSSRGEVALVHGPAVFMSSE
jgi:hypothetical protein